MNTAYPIIRCLVKAGCIVREFRAELIAKLIYARDEQLIESTFNVKIVNSENSIQRGGLWRDMSQEIVSNTQWIIQALETCHDGWNQPLVGRVTQINVHTTQWCM